MNKRSLFILFLLVICYNAYAQERFSAAGFYTTNGSERSILDFNSGWRFHRGTLKDAFSQSFNDRAWEVVNLPHTVELMPSEASGSRNYQGPAWYRKHFTIDAKYQGKRLSLYFEAIMGKSSFYVNGQKVKEHFGGFLPVTIDLTKAGVKAGDEVTIAVCADNSDDPSFPPGRKQYTMDFSVFGGIYRDCYFISTNDVHITDANAAGQTASGGVFVSYENVSDQKATVNVKTHVANEGNAKKKVAIETILIDATGKKVTSGKKSLQLAAGGSKSVEQQLSVKNACPLASG